MRGKTKVVALRDAEVPTLHPERFADVLAPQGGVEFEDATRRAHELLAGRTVWNVNSTAQGG